MAVMPTYVITGGTHGIGAALAARLTTEGHRVLVVGRSASGPHDTELIRGDLSTVAGTTAIAHEITRRTDTVDGLVLSAGLFNTRRVLTADGTEQTFAVNPLSRYVLTDLLRPALEKTPTPVVVSLCGFAGLRGPGLQWDDLTLQRYTAFGSVSHSARAADLIGAGFHDAYPGSPVRYVLHNPLFVDTGLGQPIGGLRGRLVDAVARVLAQRPARAADIVHRFLADPPDEPLTASRKGALLDLDRPELDRDQAARLYALLARLSAQHGPA